MAREVAVKQPFRSLKMSLLITLPMALWSLLMFSRSFKQGNSTPTRIAGVVVMCFMVWLFYKMVRTGTTYRWRRYFFVALGFLFPVGFIASLIAERGSMSIGLDQMVGGNTPFCFMVIPVVIIPAALTKTIIFPGSIMPTATNPHSIAVMIGLWLGATLVLGKAWCAYGCFFGGIEEGFSGVMKRAKLKNIDPRFRYVPWALLLLLVLLSAMVLEPLYCSWLCPFKTVTEFERIHSVETAIQAGIFVSLFVGLVVALPLLTKRRTQCAFFCPFGAFQSIFDKINIFQIRIDREKCKDCVICRGNCPTMAISEDSLKKGKMLTSCMRCGECVDQCPSGAAVWHIKGTQVNVKPERARLMFLYASWAFATMFGGSIIAGSLSTMLRWVM